MKTKDLVTITSVAAGTAVLTVMTFWPGPSVAGSEAEALPAKIATPKLLAKGVEFTLSAADPGDCRAGGAPRFELRAVNSSLQPAAVAVRISMTRMGATDMISRVARPESFVWQEDRLFTLKPNETQTVAIAPNTKLQPNNLVSVWLEEIVPVPADSHRFDSPGRRGPRVLALSFPTGGKLPPVAATVPALTRPAGILN